MRAGKNQQLHLVAEEIRQRIESVRKENQQQRQWLDVSIVTKSHPYRTRAEFLVGAAAFCSDSGLLAGFARLVVWFQSLLTHHTVAFCPLCDRPPFAVCCAIILYFEVYVSSNSVLIREMVQHQYNCSEAPLLMGYKAQG